jgi:hypothetical protein
MNTGGDREISLVSALKKPSGFVIVTSGMARGNSAAGFCPMTAAVLRHTVIFFAQAPQRKKQKGLLGGP